MSYITKLKIPFKFLKVNAKVITLSMNSSFVSSKLIRKIINKFIKKKF